MGRTAPGAVHQEQGFASVGERDEQRMVAPQTLVMVVHARLALSRRWGWRPIRLDHRLLEERLVLHRPDTETNFVDGLHQVVHVQSREAPTEVAGRRRVRDSGRSQDIQVLQIVSQPLKILETRATT